MTADSTTQQDFEQERPPMPGEMTVLEHLRELRNRVVISVIVLVLGLVLCLAFWETILGWMLAPARADPDLVGPNGEEFRVSSFSPLDRIGVAFKIGLYGGLMIASPMIIYQLLAFIHPALSGREKKVLYSGLIPIVGFLLGGMAFAYWVVLPASLGFLLNFGGDQIDTVTGVREYTDFVIRIVFWVGVSFELPVVMALASVLGLVRAKQYISFWRYALVALAIISAIVTPTPDFLTFSYVFVPLALLYVLGVGMSWVVQPKRAPAET